MMKKTIDEILKAPPEILNALEEHYEMFDAWRLLKADIIDKLNSRVYMVAINALCEYQQRMLLADAKYRASGYTAGDSFALQQHEGKDDKNE